MLYPVHKKLGFTVVELIVVIVVIGILASIGVVAYRGVQDRAYNVERLNEMKGWESIFSIYASQEKSIQVCPPLAAIAWVPAFQPKHRSMPSLARGGHLLRHLHAGPLPRQRAPQKATVATSCRLVQATGRPVTQLTQASTLN